MQQTSPLLRLLDFGLGYLTQVSDGLGKTLQDEIDRFGGKSRKAQDDSGNRQQEAASNGKWV